jgi:hypothetical protein
MTKLLFRILHVAKKIIDRLSMGITGIENKLADQLKVADSIRLESLLKLGDKKVEINNSNNYSIVVMSSADPSQRELEVKKARSLIESEGRKNEESLSVIPSPFLGIVNSANLPGTRLQVEFAVVNKKDEPVALNGVYIELDGGQVFFKKFILVNSDGIRVPDFQTRFPIVINRNGVARLAVEFENYEVDLIKEGQQKIKIVATAGSEIWGKGEAVLDTNKALLNTLRGLNQRATQDGPIVFDVMVETK